MAAATVVAVTAAVVAVFNQQYFTVIDVVVAVGKAQHAITRAL